MTTIEQYQELKQEIGDLQQSIAKVEGQLQETMKSLKKIFDLDTLEEAENHIYELDQLIKKLKVKLEKMEKLFDDKWGEKLNEPS